MASLTAFQGSRKLVSGTQTVVALKVKEVLESNPEQKVLVFRDDTGEQVDLDLQGTESQVKSRYSDPKPKAGPGRPKLGVVAREITLLPRHWDWLAKQSGGASVAIRNLVESAIKETDGNDGAQLSRDACYRFISVLAGNLANFEEASRALFAGNQAKFRELIATWPMDIQIHALYLSWDSWSKPAKPEAP